MAKRPSLPGLEESFRMAPDDKKDPDLSSLSSTFRKAAVYFHIDRKIDLDDLMETYADKPDVLLAHKKGEESYTKVGAYGLSITLVSSMFFLYTLSTLSVPYISGPLLAFGLLSLRSSYKSDEKKTALLKKEIGEYKASLKHKP